MSQVQILSNELSNTCTGLSSAEEQHTVLTEGLPSGTSSRQQTSKSNASSALQGGEEKEEQTRAGV